MIRTMTMPINSPIIRESSDEGHEPDLHLHPDHGRSTASVGNQAAGLDQVPSSREAPTVVTFAEGLIGLPEAKHFEFDASEEIAPFLRMRCLDRPGTSFLVVDPALVLDDYEPRFGKDVLDAVGLAPDGSPLVLTIACISSRLEECTTNLMAPIVVNPTSLLGLQVVLDSGPYGIRHPLAPASREHP